MDIIFHSLGLIHSPFQDLADMPIQPSGEASAPGMVEIYPEFVSGLKDLEGFSHIVLLYHLHKVRHTQLTVVPFLDSQPRGVFATRAPVRAVSLEEQQTSTANERIISVQDGNDPPEPVWMASWRQSDTFERDAGILKMIAETGLARRMVIEAQAAELLGIKKAGGSIQSLMTRLEDLHLIERFRPWTAYGAGIGGKFPDLVRLTDQGRLAYWLLTSQQPQVNEYDLLLERHVSPEHTLLNLQAADVLREAGYQVNLTLPEITLPDGGLFRPDLAIVDDQGATHFVEVECDVDKNIEQRQTKWRNFYQANGGRIFVVCDNRICMRNIRSEINYCLGNSFANQSG